MKKQLSLAFLFFIVSGILSYGLYGCSKDSDDNSSTSSSQINDTKKCGAGLYKSADNSQCTQVEEGFVSPKDKNKKTKCSGNEYPNENSSACQPCPEYSHADEANSACESDIISCAIANGSGTRTWNSSRSAYNTCSITGCNTGHYEENSQCVPVSGEYISPAGQTQRTSCLNNTLPNAAKDTCVPCPPNHEPNAQFTTCTCTSSCTPSANASLILDTPEEISALNASTYTLKGTCSENGQPVQVAINTSEVTESTNCQNYAWNVTLNLSVLNTTPPSLKVQHKKAGESGDGTVINQARLSHSFTCPAGYIPVPKLQGYTLRDFCVSQLEERKPENSPNQSRPYVKITRTDSRKYCKNKTSGSGHYHLISNDQWQTLARNIVSVADNWEDGNIGGTALNQGIISFAKYKILPHTSGDKNNPCFQTGVTCDFNTWHKYRRTHTLSNGQRIWDLSGNVGEWVREAFRSSNNNYSSSSYVALIENNTYKVLKRPQELLLKSLFIDGQRFTEKKTAKELFGPAEDYTALNSSPYGGLGFAYFDGARPLMHFLRGGTTDNNVGPNGQHGIFSINRNRSGAWDDVGFRCVFNPNPTKNPCHAIHKAGSASCSKNFTRFYYDKNQNKCPSFAYSGCGGNTNNFQTELNCLRACKKW